MKIKEDFLYTFSYILYNLNRYLRYGKYFYYKWNKGMD